MSFAAVYLLAVLPLLLLATAAVWPPRLWQAALLMAGPAITLAAVLEVWPVPLLGWVSDIGVAYAVLTVAPALPWRRRWARLAIPATTAVVCATFIGAAGGDPAVVFYLAPPLLLAVASLTVALLRLRGKRRQTDPPADTSSSGSGETEPASPPGG